MDTMPAKIPATVITGFLGAGKTTLIRHLLENADGRKIALIVNEFGDVGVDGDTLKSCGVDACPEENIVELANGCICCTVADDFVPTMKTLIDREDAPDHIIIETSGLALPKPLVQAFNWPEVRTRVTVDGVITLVDADAMAAGRFAHDEEAVQEQRLADEMLDHDTPLGELFEDQLNCADMVVLTKADLAGTETVTKIEETLKGQVRDGGSFLEAAQGVVPVDALLGLGVGAEDQIDARHSHHDHHHEHDHAHFDSFVAPIAEASDPYALARKLSAVGREHKVLRMKGFIPVEGRDMRLQVQVVGPRVNWHYDRAWRDGEPRQGRLVVIGEHDMDRAAIEAALA
ncbi:MAG: cobalamin biosynthesis protein CobW [Sphingomonadales bacterium]